MKIGGENCLLKNLFWDHCILVYHHCLNATSLQGVKHHILLPIQDWYWLCKTFYSNKLKTKSGMDASLSLCEFCSYTKYVSSLMTWIDSYIHWILHGNMYMAKKLEKHYTRKDKWKFRERKKRWKIYQYIPQVKYSIHYKYIYFLD